jgi:hypothetical protein
MTAVMTGPDIPAMTLERRCQIDEVFASPFIELIGLAPKNPVVRGLILAQTGKMPGRERETFEQIKEWVETTCEKKSRPPNGTRSPSRNGIAIRVEFSETEYGRAQYSVDRSGSDEFTLDAQELLEFVQAAIDDEHGLEEVVEKIAGKIDDDGWDQCSPDLDSNGDYEYDEHNSTDSCNSTIEFSRIQIRDRLLVFLRDQHPGLLEELT